MRNRRLGRSSLEVSELGYGAWGIGGANWIGADDGESLRALAKAISLGVNFIDTALAYASGHSERLVGEAVRAAGDDVYVATKMPTKNGHWPSRPGMHADEMYPAEWIVECTETSLSNLGLETIDVQQMHTWSDEWLEQGSWAEAISDLKQAGKIRFFGVSINNHEPSNAVQLVNSGLVDSVQVIYNIFDQSPEDELFHAVTAHDVGVIARVPFDEGSLAGQIRPDTQFPKDDFRNIYFKDDRRQEVWERVEALAADLGVPVDAVPAVALRFCVSHPAVSTVIPGMRSTAHVVSNAETVAEGPLADDVIAALRKHRWLRDFYTDLYG